MELDTYTRFVLALLIVLGLIFLVAALVRRYGPMSGPARGGRTGRRRLQVVEAIMVDPRRRLLLVRRDDREHLLLIGGTTDLVVEAGIALPLPQTTTPDAADTGASEPTPSFRTLLGRTGGGRP
ncbi:flagellar biosynthetic protein FliO [Roseospira navarrensis]|uniref:Flagellar assembly protein FliO n=1 Tax=Roseospira navarrensis TaxID=140058 RepID=A0A7X2D1Z7_9PROT|nr:flagellar biosynthetic protein FliO [Roseospira navarrensis]MQX35228.1 hypothetical protein [Roseospira navarrensis]